MAFLETRLDSSSREPFSTSMIMGGRVSTKKILIYSYQVIQSALFIPKLEVT